VTLVRSIYGGHQPPNRGSFSYSPNPRRCFPGQAGGGRPRVPAGGGSQGQGQPGAQLWLPPGQHRL